MRNRYQIPSLCDIYGSYGILYLYDYIFIIYILLSQVKAANQLLKKIPQGNGRRKVDGVPVFTAQNLDIAIATADGIKWCVIMPLYEKNFECVN